jgi:hypothetical protein
MTIIRIGVIADTHVPDLLPALPAGVAAAFQDVDLILHAGDITSISVLHDLGQIAPTIAVRGEEDTLDLPLKQLIVAGGLHIGLIHGRRRSAAAEAAAVSDVLMGRTPRWSDFLDDLVGSFEGVDAIVFGHVHRPHMSRHGGILLFSPGSVFQRTVESTRAELAAKLPAHRRLALQHWLKQAEERPDSATLPPNLGILTIVDGAIEAQICVLDAPQQETA